MDITLCGAALLTLLLVALRVGASVASLATRWALGGPCVQACTWCCRSSRPMMLSGILGPEPVMGGSNGSTNGGIGVTSGNKFD